MKRPVTDWDEYHRRVRISQNFLWTVWQAYASLLRGFNFSRPIRILELGCGTGYHTLKMTGLYPTEKVTLVDFNANVIEDTRRRFLGLDCEKEFLLGDLFKLDLGGEYDIVHSQGLLEHYTPDERQRLIRLHRDLLSPDGIAVILVPTNSLPYRFWRGLLERLKLWIYHDETAIPRADFIRELESNGLEILRIQGCHLMEVGAVCRRAEPAGAGVKQAGEPRLK